MMKVLFLLSVVLVIIIAALQSVHGKDDVYYKVEYTSWTGNLANSVTGVLFGIILFIAAEILLFWNEGRAVRTKRTLQEGQGIVQSVPSDKVDDSFDGKLVFISGRTFNATDKPVRDDILGIHDDQAIKLKRCVEMYQWQESSSSHTEKHVGGGSTKITKYTYHQQWSSSAIDSSKFQQSGHDNPAFTFQNQDFVAQSIKAGAFELSPGLVNLISDYKEFKIVEQDPVVQRAIQYLNSQKYWVHVLNNGFYLGQNPSSPQLGDTRITYSICNPSIVSIIAKQQGNQLIAYHSKIGGSIELLQSGNSTPDEMFASALSSNAVTTWLLRLAGWIMLLIGFALMFDPIATLADVLPILGSIVRLGTGTLGFVLSIIFSLTTIAIAWFFYRPLLSLVLFSVVAIVIYGVSYA